MFILSIIHSFFTFEPSLSPFFRLNVLWFRGSSTERKASPFEQTAEMHPDHQPARLLAVTLPWAIICSFGISIQGYDTRSLPARAPRRPLRIWRLRLFVFGVHCSHLDASPASWGRGVGGGCATVYLWQQDKHDRNAKSLAYLLNSAFSPDWQAVSVVWLLEECVSLQVLALPSVYIFFP